MKLTGAMPTAIAAVAAMLAFGIVAQAGPSDSRPEGAGRDQNCSLRSLNGSYGVKFEGVRLPDKRFNSVAVIKFDGKGKFTSSETGRFDGQPIKRTFSGPYIVKPDCTGFLDFSSNITNPPHEAHGAFVIVDQGQGMFFLDDEDEWAAGGVGRKL